MSEYLDINIQNGQLYTSDGNKLDINQKECKVVITKPRNIKHLGKYWKLMEFTAYNSPEWAELNDKDDTHSLICERFGKKVYTPDGKLSHIKPISIKFSSMDQLAFDEHYSRSLDLCAKIIGCAPEAVIQELVGFM